MNCVNGAVVSTLAPFAAKTPVILYPKSSSFGQIFQTLINCVSGLNKQSRLPVNAQNERWGHCIAAGTGRFLKPQRDAVRQKGRDWNPDKVSIARAAE